MMSFRPPALEIAGLTKRFGGIPAVDRLDLTIPQGEFHALLGPNGAGKTTTLRMVAGLLNPDSGRIHVMGHDMMSEPGQAKANLAFLPDDPLLYGKLRALEYLEFVAGLWGITPDIAMRRAEELLRLLDLWKHSGELVEGYSRGMQQKLALAGALIHDPVVLILDEPLTGLDAAAARLVKDLLLEMVARGGTVILTTHILEIAERLAQRISIVHRGRVIAQGGLDELRADVSAQGKPDSTLEEVFLQLTAGGET
ncbi:ABC transporter ATP-binding protein [Massilia sp. Root335]|jgi:ABC-2 type transport system ATP-binding protein|uniref:ABC transporter ATP-binding protein n=1 Tax=Massilia sp. Root335 TaxID=1736517 RepID=UPI000A98B75F|nr:ABC transporter ATP-binding protein [Massilia sp. Root335]